MDRSSMLQQRSTAWGALPLMLGFCATGVGVALPGALLPVLQARWHLQDERAGRLFLVAWIGSSLGALVVRGSLRTTLLLGALAVCIASAGLARCTGDEALLFMTLFGFGLGAVMTSISLIRQQQTSGSGTELVRLNLVWALGACLTPSLTTHALAVEHGETVFWSLCFCFACLAMTAFFQPALRLEPVVKGAAPNETALFRLPFGLILLIFLVTGIEAAAGGWLTTFTHRYDATLAISIAVPTCFWAGLLLSRLFWSLYDGSTMEAGTVRGSLMLMTIASILLISLNNSLVTLVAAFLLGFGIGPTYPLLLGWALRHKQGAGIFFLAGVGSACLPWLTGLISAQHSSLRVGLVVPTAGTLLMLVVAMLSPLHLWSQPTGSKDPFSSPGLQPRR